MGHVPQKDLANDLMDQNETSGEFGLPTSTERAFMVTNPGRVTALRTERGQRPPSVRCTPLSTLPPI